MFKTIDFLDCILCCVCSLIVKQRVESCCGGGGEGGMNGVSGIIYCVDGMISASDGTIPINPGR
jgi:hypothetical protein